MQYESYGVKLGWPMNGTVEIDTTYRGEETAYYAIASSEDKLAVVRIGDDDNESRVVTMPKNGKFEADFPFEFEGKREVVYVSGRIGEHIYISLVKDRATEGV